MIKKDELIRIASQMLEVLDSRGVNTADDLEREVMLGTEVKIGEGDEIGFSETRSEVNTRGLVFYYGRKGYGYVINAILDLESKAGVFIIQANCEIFGYKRVHDDRLFQQQPAVDFSVIRNELERLTERNYYLRD